MQAGHHEPWADEAQSWLIARDNHTLAGLLYAVKYEGTLPVWHLLLKAFQLAGLDYGHIYIIPLLLTAAGVVILFAPRFGFNAISLADPAAWIA